MKKTTYTLTEAAVLLSCHKETLRRAIKEGSLRAARLGRGWRVSKVDLEAFWIAQGGGDLFSKQDSSSSDAYADNTQNKATSSDSEKGKPQPNKTVKATGPLQLTLPTS